MTSGFTLKLCRISEPIDKTAEIAFISCRVHLLADHLNQNLLDVGQQMLRVRLEDHINKYRNKAIRAFFLTKMSYQTYSSRQVCMPIVGIQGM
jgi:hypothetical protein